MAPLCPRLVLGNGVIKSRRMLHQGASGSAKIGSKRLGQRLPQHLPVRTRATNQQASLLKQSDNLVLQQLKGGEVSDVFVSGDVTRTSAAKTFPRRPTLSATSFRPDKVVSSVQSLFLPDGYPATTTPDMLTYQLWALPTHILGSVAHALTTSSLLSAVGVSAGPVAVTATSAAMKWITKDGFGALGRFIVGGSLSQEFDRDPRRWRMIAELCTSTGAGLEIATAAFPQYFLLLAGLGNFAKRLGKAIGKPVFRVIQTHFAADNNVGEIAAKEEVWEVVAQLAGYGVSLTVLSAVDAMIVKEQGGVSSGTELVAIWAAVQSAHIVLRYQSLRSLIFSGLNEKRARMIISDHVSGQPIRDVRTVNQQEPILPAASSCMQPTVHLGTMGVADVLLEATIQATGSNSHTQEEVDGSLATSILQLYANEGHILVWTKKGEALVVLRAGAGTRSVVRALWQAHWLHHCSQQHGYSPPEAMMSLLAASVRALESQYEGFESEARDLGWDVSHIKMGAGDVRFQVVS